MKEQMRKIIQQQQEYEYIKKSPTLFHISKNNFYSDLIDTKVFSYMEKEFQNRIHKKLQTQFSRLTFYLSIIFNTLRSIYYVISNLLILIS